MKTLVLKLISEAKIGEAIDLLIPHSDEFYLLKGRYNSNRNNFFGNLISKEYYDIENARIANAIRELIKDLDLPEKSETHADGSATIEPAMEDRDFPSVENEQPKMPKSIFFSYAHYDEDFVEELNVHLASLRRSNKIDAWYDSEIRPGQEWDDEIKENLRKADIILLLVSPRFIASDYIWKYEVNMAMDRHKNGEAIVVPVIIKSCDWHDMPFAKLQGLPKGMRPVDLWENRDAAWVDVVRGLRRLL